MNLRQSLYNTRIDMEDIAEGGTQTTPNLEKTSIPSHPPKAAPELSETGCQVTPSLKQPVLQQTVEEQSQEMIESEDQQISVTQDSIKVSKLQATVKQCVISTLPYSPLVNTPSSSNRKDKSKESQDHFEGKHGNDELAIPQYEKNKSKGLVDSFTEVDLEDFGEENDSSDVEDMNISGRKNPSPLQEEIRDLDVVSEGDNEDEKSNNDKEDELDEQVDGNEYEDLNHIGKEHLIVDEFDDKEDPDQSVTSVDYTDKNCNDDKEEEVDVEQEHQMDVNSPTISGPVRPMMEPKVRVLPNSKERKEMRQATLVRYLGIQDTRYR